MRRRREFEQKEDQGNEKAKVNEAQGTRAAGAETVERANGRLHERLDQEMRRRREFEQKEDQGNEVAPRNPGKEEEAHVLKPFAGTLRVRIPSGRAWTSGRKRVLRGGG